MTWFKVDDNLTSNKKWLQLDVYAESLWLHAGVWCAAHNNDGVIPEHTLRLVSLKVPIDKVTKAVDQLVRANLWRKLPKSKGGGWEIVNWLEYQPSKAQVERKAETSSLHDWLHKNPQGKLVKAAIRRRDGIGCRYCGTECRTDGDRRSTARLTYDLIDPDSTWDRTQTLTQEQIRSIAELWAVACGHCNAVKARRTPSDAELPLRPSPRTQSLPAPICRDLPRPNRDPVAKSGRDGSDLNGSALVGSVAANGSALQHTSPHPSHLEE